MSHRAFWSSEESEPETTRNSWKSEGAEDHDSDALQTDSAPFTMITSPGSSAIVAFVTASESTDTPSASPTRENSAPFLTTMAEFTSEPAPATLKVPPSTTRFDTLHTPV